MELFIELLLELLFEGASELSNNKKVPKWLRYTILSVLLLILSAIVMGLIVISVMLILNGELWAGLIIIAVGILLFGLLIYKVMQVHKEIKKK